MTQDWVEKLQRIDVAMLTDLVSQDQRSPDFVILDWTVEPLRKKDLAGQKDASCFTARVASVKQ